jgi:hypothetical protein
MRIQPNHHKLTNCWGCLATTGIAKLSYLLCDISRPHSISSLQIEKYLGCMSRESERGRERIAIALTHHSLAEQRIDKNLLTILTRAQELMKSSSNYKSLRQAIATAQRPCLPYLGMQE